MLYFINRMLVRGDALGIITDTFLAAGLQLNIQ
jgi:hypothetical protein